MAQDEYIPQWAFNEKKAEQKAAADDDQEQARHEREEELRRIPPVRPSRKEGLRTISLTEADVFQVDKTGRLYWDGKPLEYSRRLTPWQTVGAFIVGCAVVLGGLGSLLQGLVVYNDWACHHVGLPSICPTPVPLPKPLLPHLGD